MKRSRAPIALRPNPAALAEWDRAVAIAQRHIAERRQIPTATLSMTTLLAMDQEIRLLRSSNEFLRARRLETPKEGN